MPVQKKYAEDLLESPQFRMLESPEASFLQERAYFSNPRTASTIPEGGCLLFYESGKDGGQSAIVGIGRIVRVTVEMKDSVSSATRRRGVLKEVDFKDLNSGGRVAVTRFDNLMMLRHPVPIQRLREIGCADGSNFVTAKRMTGEQIAAIVKEGDKRG